MVASGALDALLSLTTKPASGMRSALPARARRSVTSTVVTASPQHGAPAWSNSPTVIAGMSCAAKIRHAADEDIHASPLQSPPLPTWRRAGPGDGGGGVGSCAMAALRHAAVSTIECSSLQARVRLAPQRSPPLPPQATAACRSMCGPFVPRPFLLPAKPVQNGRKKRR